VAAALILAALARPAAAQVVYANSSSQTSGNLQTHTWVHLVPPGGAFRYLVVGVAIDHTNRAPTVVSVTYAGFQLAPLGGATHADQVRVELWGLAGPPEGMGTIALRLTGPRGFAAGAISFTGVHPTQSAGPAASGTGTSVVAQVPVPAAADERIVDVYGSPGLAEPMEGVGQTRHYLRQAPVTLAGSSQAGAAGSVSSWATPGTDQPWALAAVPLRAAPPVDAGAADGGTPDDAGADAPVDAVSGGADVPDDGVRGPRMDAPTPGSEAGGGLDGVPVEPRATDGAAIADLRAPVDPGASDARAIDVPTIRPEAAADATIDGPAGPRPDAAISDGPAAGGGTDVAPGTEDAAAGQDASPVRRYDLDVGCACALGARAPRARAAWLPILGALLLGARSLSRARRRARARGR
jgi:hypothetical protein